MRPLATISVLSREPVLAPVCVEENGLPLNPTGFQVECAYPLGDQDPVDADWVVGWWETGNAPNDFFAVARVGPGGQVELDAGEYGVWVRVTAGLDLPVIRAGTLVVSTTDARRGPIATVGELQRKLGRPLPEEWQEAAEDVLAEVQGALETKLGRPVTVRTFTETRTFEGEDVLRLARTPLVRLRSLKVDGLTIDPANVLPRRYGIEGIWYAISAAGGASVDTGLPLQGNPYTPDLAQTVVTGFMVYRTGTVQIEYDAGIDGLAQDNSALKLVVVRAAARELVRAMDDLQGVKDLAIEGYRVTLLDPDEIFTAGEIQGLHRYKRRTVL